MDTDEDKPTQVRYPLKHPIKYGSKGDEKQGIFLELREPNAKCSPDVAYFRQAYMRSQKDLQDALSDEDKDEIKAKIEERKEEPVDTEAAEEADVLTLIQMSSVDYPAVLERWGKYISAGSPLDACFVAGEARLTNHLYELMSAADVEGSLAKFYTAFITASS